MLWEFCPPSQFRKLPNYVWDTLDANVQLSKIAHFNLKLLHYDDKTPSRTSLLTLLARNKNNLEDLDTFRMTGEGDIVSGIGKILGDTISSLAKGGSQIIRSLGKGIKDTLNGLGSLDESVVGSIGNATAKIFTTSTLGLAKIISSLGGLGTIILWALVVLVYLYLFMMRIPNPPPPPPPLPLLISTQNSKP